MKLSKPQRQIYNMESLMNGSVSCVCGCMLLDTVKSEDEINNALNIMYRMNDALRIRIQKNGEEVSQYISDFTKHYIPALHFDSREELNAYAASYAKIPFAPDGPLSEITPVILPSYSGVLIKLHHIISDGWTCALVASQMKLLLTGYMPEAYSYADYLITEEEYLGSKRYIKDKEYFTSKINECSEPLFISAKPDISFKAERKTFIIEETELLENFSRKLNTSVFAVVLAVTSFYFSRIKENADNFFIGTTVLNRTGEKERNTMGMYVNTVPVLMKPDYAATVSDNISAVSSDVLSVLKHQKFNYTDLLEESGKGKLFDVIVSYQNAQIVNGETIIEWYSNGMQAENLQIHIEDHDADGTLKMHFDYRTDKFTEDEILALHKHIFNLIDDCITNPDKKIGELSMLSEDEKHKILVDFNDTYLPYDEDTSVYKLFEEQAEKKPDETAIIGCDNILTFKELNEKVNRIAHALAEKGIGRGDIVAFRMRRTTSLVASMLAILKTGAAYMPVDPDYPEERISYMLSDSGARFCITDESINELLENDNKENLNIQFNSSDVCYCIYTSGSTGKPKGTLITHRNIVNYVTANEKNVCSGIIKDADTILSVTTAGFDIFVTETLLPLANGMKIVLADEEESRMQSQLIKLLKKHPCDILQTTPTKMKTFIADKSYLEFLKGFKAIILGGETLESSLIEELKEKTSAEIYNIYGPTETTVWVTYAKVEDIGNITIGKPMANTQIYIVDKYMNLLPIGVPGEICIAGMNVGQGYLNNIELTSEKFIDNPFGKGKLYRTGDRGYWREDGNIVFVGRNDFQVKIRGLRIELGEIEKAISAIEGIEFSVAVVRKDKDERQLICAFYTGKESTSKELRAELERSLPKYMVPHVFIHLDEMPLTFSGKINRKALPEVDFESIDTATEYVAPETEKEKTLADCISDVLGNEKVSILDNFFDIGGDSLKAIELSAKLEAKGCEISVKEIFESKNLRELAKNLEEKETEYVKIEYGNEIPATAAQMRVYTSQHLKPDSAYYNIPYVFRVQKLDISRLENAVNALIARHESLRTRFENRNGQIMQIIEENASINVQKLESDDITAFNTPFELEKAPLLRVGYFENTIFFVIHHIIADGETMNIIFRELNELYMGRELPEAVQYGEFAVTDGYTSENEAYWLNAFEELPEAINLKSDFDSPEKKTFAGSEIYELIDTHNKIEEFYKKQGITPYVFYMACYSILLSKYSGNEDIIIAMPVSGREGRFIDSVGMFVNTVALRTKPKGNKSITQFLNEVKDASLKAIENQNYPISELIQKLNINISAHNPLTDIMFAYQSEEATDIVFGDNKAEILPVRLAGVKCDLNFTIMPRENDAVLMVEFSTDLFKEDTVNEFISAYKSILEAAIDETKKIKEISVTDAEKFASFNETEHVYDIPENTTLYSLFEKTARENTEKICIKTAEREMTFGELCCISENLDAEIRKITDGKKSVIGVIAERSLEMYSAVYGIIRGGNAYLPIDPNYPPERIEYILGNSNATAVVCQGKFTHLAGKTPCIDITEFLNTTQKSENTLPSCADENDTAYVIYTSGSTGNPKGAKISHKSAVNRILWMHEKYPLGKDDVILQKTPYTFDVSVWELFWWGMVGGCLAASKPDEHFLPEKILLEAQKNKVTHIHFVPSVFELFLNYLESHKENISKFESVKYVFLSGEALSASLVNRFYKLYDYEKVTLHNLYGPTECAVDVTYYDCKPDDSDPVPIGKPIYNTQMHIVDKYMNLVPIGVQGELCISGVNVGQGYLNNPELTEEKFIDNPFGEDKLYKTGDLAYRREDGNIIFCGRNDFQVKIHGQRIELGEIEDVINGIIGVSSSSVIVKNINGTDVLIAFYTGHAVDASSLEECCSVKLPSYMVPGVFVYLDKLPLNSSGKLDRKALAQIDIEPPSDEGFMEPENETEKLICEIFSRVLEVENIGRNSDFFRIGGTSLSMISILSEDIFENITAADFIHNSTPAKLARKIAKPAEKTLSYLEPLYISDKTEKTLILLPFAGGGAEAFSALVNSIKKKNALISVYYVRYLHSFEECKRAADEIAAFIKKSEVMFYSHCVGSAVALQIIKELETKEIPVKHYFAGASIPPVKPVKMNLWNIVPDGILKTIIAKAGADISGLSDEKLSKMLMRFRKDTDFANISFSELKGKIKTPVSVIISKKDMFTKNYRHARSLWEKYAGNVEQVYYIESDSHYFQSESSERLTDLIVKNVI